MYTKADKGRKATPRRQNNGRHTSMVTRKRHQYHKLSRVGKSEKGRKVTPRRLNKDRRAHMPNRHRHRIRSETEADNDRKANHSKQTNERQTRMPNRYRTRSEKEADNSRKGTHSKQTNEMHSSMPNRHHTLSEFAKADKGNLKATHRRQKNKILHTTHQLQKMLSERPTCTACQRRFTKKEI